MKTDILPGTAAFSIDAIIYIPGERYAIQQYKMNPKAPGGMEPFVPHATPDHDIEQFHAECPVAPISEQKFRLWFRELEEKMLKAARGANLVLA